MLNSEAVARQRTTAAETVHLWSDNIGTERAKGLPVFDYLAVRGDDD